MIDVHKSKQVLKLFCCAQSVTSDAKPKICSFLHSQELIRGLKSPCENDSHKKPVGFSYAAEGPAISFIIYICYVAQMRHKLVCIHMPADLILDMMPNMPNFFLSQFLGD